jgi:hypothetical protein
MALPAGFVSPTAFLTSELQRVLLQFRRKDSREPERGAERERRNGGGRCGQPGFRGTGQQARCNGHEALRHFRFTPFPLFLPFFRNFPTPRRFL